MQCWRVLDPDLEKSLQAAATAVTVTVAATAAAVAGATVAAAVASGGGAAAGASSGGSGLLRGVRTAQFLALTSKLCVVNQHSEFLEYSVSSEGHILDTSYWLKKNCATHLSVLVRRARLFGHERRRNPTKMAGKGFPRNLGSL